MLLALHVFISFTMLALIFFSLALHAISFLYHRWLAGRETKRAHSQLLSSVPIPDCVIMPRPKQTKGKRRDGEEIDGCRGKEWSNERTSIE